jgi:hypothetical protein
LVYWSSRSGMLHKEMEIILMLWCCSTKIISVGLVKTGIGKNENESRNVLPWNFASSWVECSRPGYITFLWTDMVCDSWTRNLHTQ